MQRWVSPVGIRALHDAPAAKLNSIVSVSIDSWWLNNRHFEFLDRLPALEAIHLGDDGSVVEVFPNSPPDLLAPVPVTAAQLAHLAGHEHLIFVEVQRIAMDDAGVAVIARLGGIRFLTLALCKLPRGSVAVIARATPTPSRGLELTGTPVDAESFAAILKLRRLRGLSIRATARPHR